VAKFISISGPSTTGKTSLIDSLSTYSNLKNVVFSPDIHDVVWKELVDLGYFTEFKEISTDSEYLCTYIIRLIEYYNKYIDSFKDKDVLVILDGCWLDISIYSILNMWYNRIIKSVQDSILESISKYDERISKIYITKADDVNYPISKYRLRGKITTFRENRPLELKYYELARHFKNAVSLPSSDISDSSLFILRDLKELGHLK